MSTPTVVNEQYELVALDQLVQHPANPRVGDIGAVCASIEAHGFFGALVVQRSTGRILAGNHRFLAAKALAMPEVPVTFVDVSDEIALRILIADNRTSDLGSYDDNRLAEILQDLAATDSGLDGLGYDGDDLDDLLLQIGLAPNGLNPDVLDPPPSAAAEALKKWKVKPGQLWAAGDQQVYCGDSRDAESYRFEGDAQIMWTDPPYGVKNVGGQKDPRSKDYGNGEDVPNDDLPEPELRALLDAALSLAIDRLQKGGAWYVAGPAGPLHQMFMGVLRPHGMRQGLVWAKHVHVFGRSDYHYQHEPILYGWRPGAAHTWTGDRKQSSVLEHDRPAPSNRAHATMKPVALIAQCIGNHREPGALVIDPFSGSGSTLLAAHHHALRGYGIELAPKFVAVTLDRLQAVGLEPELVA